MFSDRYRMIKIGCLLAALAGLAWYSTSSRPILTLEQCLADQERFDGSEVPIFLEARVLDISPDILRATHPDGPVDIVIPPRFNGMVPEGNTLDDVEPGHTMEALTVFRRPGYLELKSLRIAPLRRLKVFISLFPALLVLIFLVTSVRWEKGRLVIKDGRESSHPDETSSRS